MSNELKSSVVERPQSVTNISWLLIIISTIGWLVMVGIYIYLSNQPRIKLQSPLLFLLVPTISTLLQIIVGKGMLNGLNWARILFFWLIPISTIIGFALSGGKISPGIFFKIVWYLVFVYYLTRPNVVSFFTSN